MVPLFHGPEGQTIKVVGNVVVSMQNSEVWPQSSLNIAVPEDGISPEDAERLETWLVIGFLKEIKAIGDDLIYEGLEDKVIELGKFVFPSVGEMLISLSLVSPEED